MSLKGERTDITYNEERRIVRLDAYLPELEPGEVDISVNVAELTKRYPLRGGIVISQEVEDLASGDYGYIVPKIWRENDTLTYEEGLEITELEDSDELLVISQHIGSMGRESVAIATSTYDMAQAEADVPAMLQVETKIADLLDDYGSSMN